MAGFRIRASASSQRGKRSKTSDAGWKQEVVTIDSRASGCLCVGGRVGAAGVGLFKGVESELQRG